MFYVVENQHRPDGIINNSIVGRQTFASALSYFHERVSKMAMTELYTKVDVVMLNDDLTQRKIEHVPTCYVAPVVEPTEEEQTEE